jgi:hypothetical protein
MATFGMRPVLVRRVEKTHADPRSGRRDNVTIASARAGMMPNLACGPATRHLLVSVRRSKLLANEPDGLAQVRQSRAGANQLAELSIDAGVAVAVCVQLRQPEVGFPLRCHVVLRTPVPEAAVDEHGPEADKGRRRGLR